MRLQPGLDGVNLKDGYPVVSVVKGMTFVLIELENEAALAKVGLTSQSPSDEGLDQGWETAFLGPYVTPRYELLDRRSEMVPEYYFAIVSRGFGWLCFPFAEGLSLTSYRCV